MIEGLEHVAIAVADLDAAIVRFRDGLGLKLLEIEDVPSQQSRVAKFALGQTSITIELVSPTSPDCPLAKSIQKRGEGLHHVALRVRELGEELNALASRGVELVDREPKPGSSGTKIAFLHPRSFGGVLVELVEPPKGERHEEGHERRGA